MAGKAVVYIRVSTEEQAISGLSLVAQEAACRAFAERSGWPVSAVFSDEGVSGSKPWDRRPGLAGAIESLGRGDYLLASKRDRIFRMDELDRSDVLRALASRRARVASADGVGNTDDSAAGRFMATVLDGAGAMERQLAIERTRAALSVKRERGERCGQIPYGFRMAADGLHLEPDPADARMVAACRRLRAGGMSLRAIAAELGELGFMPKRGGAFGASTVRRILARGDETCPET